MSNRRGDHVLERLDRIESLLAERSDEPLSLKEAAEYLDVSASHLYKLTSTARIAHYKPAGKKIYFRKADLNAYLLRNRVKPEDEIDQEAATRVALGQ